MTEQEYVVVGPKSIRLFCLQVEVAAWSMRNFGQQPSTNPLLGVVEELGELCHAHLKMLQGIRGTKVEHHKAKIDAVGDVVIYLADYCHREGIDLEDTVARTWEEVRSRNWKADPTHGTDKQLDLQLEHG